MHDPAYAHNLSNKGFKELASTKKYTQISQQLRNSQRVILQFYVIKRHPMDGFAIHHLEEKSYVIVFDNYSK